jgi:hypothetical protein
MKKERYQYHPTSLNQREFRDSIIRHMILSIIFLEDKHNVLLHLSIFYEYQQIVSTPYLFLDTAATSTRKFT